MNFIDERKKQRERKYLAKFCAACEDIPAGEPIPAENPDFIIPGQAGGLGIEVTEYYRQSQRGERSIQEQESLRYQIVARAKKLFEKAGGSPLYVGVHFRPYDTVDKADIDHYASILMNLVGSSSPRDEEMLRLPDRPFRFLPVPFCVIDIGRFSVLTDGFWSVPDSTFVPSLEIHELQTILDAKNARLETYRRRAPIVWLLIVAQGTRVSSVVSVPGAVSEHAYTFAFDRAFYLDYFAGTYWELNKGHE